MATSQTNDAADDAGQAAYDQAAKSHWPPTKEDIELVGAAAGAAAGTALGGPVGTVIGTAVGGFVGGVVYEIIDAIPDAGDNPTARCVLQFQETIRAYNQAIIELSNSCNTSEDDIRVKLSEWDWKGPLTDRNLCYNPAAGMAALEQNKKQFFRSIAAVSAECETRRQGIGKKSTFGTVVVLGVASAIGIGIIQKLITRGKF